MPLQPMLTHQYGQRDSLIQCTGLSGGALFDGTHYDISILNLFLTTH
jgi:hypothetical protein